MVDETVVVAPAFPEPTPEEIAAAQAVLARIKPAAVPEAPPQPTGPCMAFRAWEKAKCAALTSFWSTIGFASCAGKAVKGLRTILFFGTVGISSLVSSIEGVDLSGVASKLTGLKIEYTDIMLGISVIGIALRLVTDSSAFKRWKTSVRGDGEAPGVGSGDVDEPSGEPAA